MLRRRVLSVSSYIGLWLIWIGLAPAWIPLTLLYDLARRAPPVAFRCACFVAFFLSCELAGLAASLALFVWRRSVGMSEAAWQDRHHRLQAWWGSTLFAGLVRSFGMHVEIDDAAELDRGPYLLLARHASSGDTLLAASLVSAPHGMRLRYVLKRELLFDPCLDIVGHRLPNVFVDRGAEDAAEEIRRVRALGEGLGAHDGVLIYPEGTRFSEAKKRQVVDGLAARGEVALVSYARSLTRVLPPRPGGTLALLEAAPDADVVLLAHAGFEGAASLAEIWRGALVGRTLRVRFRRIPRERVPSAREERVAWLRDEWREIDRWIAAAEPAAVD